MNSLTNIQSLSIRGRVAYLLSIADIIFLGIDDNTDACIQANAGLEKCWDWASGNSRVLGDDIYYFLSNENDTGLDVYTYQVDKQDIKFPIWVIIVFVIMYVAWQAYNLDGEKYVPQDIEGVDEKKIDDIFYYLNQVPTFDKHYAYDLKNKLLKEFPFDPANEFGAFILKEQIIN